MAKTATALAERFQELGFRLIEGGKRGDEWIIKSNGIPEMFPKLDGRHDNVMRDIRQQREKLPSPMRAVFDEHCRPSKYRGVGQGARELDCFDLTKTGFLTTAFKYDDVMPFLGALAVDALESGDEYAQATILQQINERIRELRLLASGQQELLFDAASEPAALTVIEPEVPQRNYWTDHYNGTAYRISVTYDEVGNPTSLYCIGKDHRRPVHDTPIVAPTDKGNQIYVQVSPDVPYEVIERNFLRLGNGRYKPVALGTLRHLFGP